MSPDNCANPLFLGWVKEWLDQARERSSRGITTYRRAYDSLNACPISFPHPYQLLSLNGFGQKMCAMLEKKLRDHCELNGLPMPEHPGFKKKQKRPNPTGNGADNEDDDAIEARPAKKARKAKLYVPAYRTGNYAIILALSGQDPNETVGMTRNDLVKAAQPHCNASFAAPSDTRSFYTAWNSMKTLESKELVCSRGAPTKRYLLTDEGWEVARAIRALAEQRGGGASGPAIGGGGDQDAGPGNTAFDQLKGIEVELPPLPPSQSEFKDVVRDGGPADSGLPSVAPIIIRPGAFTVELLLDTREVRSTTDRTYVPEQLKKKGVPVTVRALEAGDAVWVARCKDPGHLSRHGAEGDMVVLDWIVERKRLDDLIMSIKSPRFNEQKYRLARSGVKNVIYLIEETRLDPTFVSRYEEAIQSTIASMQVVHGCFVKRTKELDESIRYLARMTMLLKKQYENKPLYVIPTTVLTAQNHLPLRAHLQEKNPARKHHISYMAFASLASKSEQLTLRDLFLKMLLCTRGLSPEKALEVQKIWKTPHELVKAFEACGTGDEGEKLKMGLVAKHTSQLVGRKKIGVGLSRRMAEVWGGLSPVGGPP